MTWNEKPGNYKGTLLIGLLFVIFGAVLTVMMRSSGEKTGADFCLILIVIGVFVIVFTLRSMRKYAEDAENYLKNEYSVPEKNYRNIPVEPKYGRQTESDRSILDEIPTYAPGQDMQEDMEGMSGGLVYLVLIVALIVMTPAVIGITDFIINFNTTRTNFAGLVVLLIILAVGIRILVLFLDLRVPRWRRPFRRIFRKRR